MRSTFASRGLFATWAGLARFVRPKCRHMGFPVSVLPLVDAVMWAINRGISFLSVQGLSDPSYVRALIAFRSNGICSVSLSLTMTIGRSRAVRIPSSKNTFGFRAERSHRTRSACSRFLIISAWINSDPATEGANHLIAKAFQGRYKEMVEDMSKMVGIITLLRVDGGGRNGHHNKTCLVFLILVAKGQPSMFVFSCQTGPA